MMSEKIRSLVIQRDFGRIISSIICQQEVETDFERKNPILVLSDMPSQIVLFYKIFSILEQGV